MRMPWMSGIPLDASIIADWGKIPERLGTLHFHQTVGGCSRSPSVAQSQYGASGMIGQHIHSNVKAGSTLLPFLRTGSKSLAFLMAALVYGLSMPKGLSMTFHKAMYIGPFSPRTASACYLVLMELQCGARKVHVVGLQKRIYLVCPFRLQGPLADFGRPASSDCPAHFTCHMPVYRRRAR